MSILLQTKKPQSEKNGNVSSQHPAWVSKCAVFQISTWRSCILWDRKRANKTVWTKNTRLPPQISKQAGNGISRRHIQGSKTAKKLQSVKYSFYNTQKTETLDRIGARKGGTLWDFLTFPSQKSNELKGGPLMEKKFQKSPTMPKNLEGGPFSLARYCMLRKKGKLPFCFSSLDQMDQFDTIQFCRAFKNYFGQFEWIEKKGTSIMKRRPKNRGTTIWSTRKKSLVKVTCQKSSLANYKSC